MLVSSLYLNVKKGQNDFLHTSISFGEGVVFSFLLMYHLNIHSELHKCYVRHSPSSGMCLMYVTVLRWFYSSLHLIGCHYTDIFIFLFKTHLVTEELKEASVKKRLRVGRLTPLCCCNKCFRFLLQSTLHT